MGGRNPSNTGRGFYRAATWGSNYRYNLMAISGIRSCSYQPGSQKESVTSLPNPLLGILEQEEKVIPTNSEGEIPFSNHPFPVKYLRES